MDNLASDHNTAFAESTQHRRSGPKGSGWFAFLMGVVVTFLFIYLGVARPAARELALMRRQMSAMEQSVWEVAGQQDSADDTKSLLKTLLEQRHFVGEARRALAEMRQLQGQLIASRQSVSEALDVVHLLADNSQASIQAQASLAEINKLHADVAVSRKAADQALQLIKTISEQGRWVDNARQWLSRFHGLKEELASATHGMSSAMNAAKSLKSLRNVVLEDQQQTEKAAEALELAQQLHLELAESLDTAGEARRAGAELLALESDVLSSAGQMRSAQVALGELVGLRDAIQEQGSDMAKANAAVVDLVSLKDQVLASTPDLADAVQTLELTTDLGLHFRDATAGFHDIRHWMVEVIAAAPLLDQAQESLAPLTSLGNLRRVSPQHIREIAQSVSQRYRTELASQPTASATPTPVDKLITTAIDDSDLTPDGNLLELCPTSTPTSRPLPPQQWLEK